MHTAIYNQVAEMEDWFWWNIYRGRLVEDVFKKRPPLLDALGLDVGCGTGSNLELLTAYCKTVIGLDISQAALDIAKKKHPGFTFARGDANCISNLFKPNEFGLITIFNCLYHEWITNVSHVLRQCYSLLQPGGIVVITEPAFQILTRKHDQQAMGKRRFRLKSIRVQLEKAGFEVTTGGYFNLLSFLPALALAMINRRYNETNYIDKEETIKELVMPKTGINDFVLRVTEIERAAIRHGFSLPFGVNLICTARKD